MVFIDDILIFSDSKQDHDRHVRAVLDTLRREGFRLKEKKREFGRGETEFVGFVATAADGEKDTSNQGLADGKDPQGCP